jgi:hypothetical protein
MKMNISSRLGLTALLFCAIFVGCVEQKIDGELSKTPPSKAELDAIKSGSK